MKCDDALERISPYLDGELQESEKKEFLDHIRQCPECKKEVEELEQLLKDFTSIEQVELPEGFHDELMANIKKSVVPISSIPKKKGSSWRHLAALAAAFLVIVVAGGGIHEMSKKGKAPIQQGPVDGADTMDTTGEKMAVLGEDESVEVEDNETSVDTANGSDQGSSTKKVEPGVSQKTMQKKPMGKDGTMVSADLSVISNVLPSNEEIILIDDTDSTVQSIPETTTEVAQPPVSSETEVASIGDSSLFALAENTPTIQIDSPVKTESDTGTATENVLQAMPKEETQAVVKEESRADEGSMETERGLKQSQQNAELQPVLTTSGKDSRIDISHINVQTDYPEETAQSIYEITEQLNGVVIKNYLPDFSAEFAEENMICLKIPVEEKEQALAQLTGQFLMTKIQQSSGTLQTEFDRIAKDRIALEQMRQGYKTAIEQGDSSQQTQNDLQWVMEEQEKLDKLLFTWEQEEKYFAVYILLEGPGTGIVAKPEIQPPNMTAVTYGETNTEE